MDDMKENIKKFVDDLLILTNKHGLYVDSCGDCSSIWIGLIDSDNHVALCLGWDRKNKKYEYEEIKNG